MPVLNIVIVECIILGEKQWRYQMVNAGLSNVIELISYGWFC